jgi:hypothetical protein
MAVQGPLLHDGSQMTAFANYYNPSSALAGPGGSGQFLFASIQASRVVQVSTTIGAKCYGVLQNTPMAGDAADVGFFGHSKMVAGASITAGAEIMCDASGRAVTWTAGSGYFKQGIALETVSAANTVFAAFVYPPVTGLT